ncbi:hypothetical protein [Flavobacterium sp.]|uniref:hypothetical protein n=1 Tax=Flavobacterium sp. TaxID=239 RepID=UPI0031D0BD08
MSRKFQDQTAADKKEIGFHYQHYYALLQLLKLDPNESLSVEEKDDIVITSSNELKLLQLKHTLQTKIDGSAKNLTSKDYSLWHTIDNWLKLICDSKDGREDESAQIAFINSTYFGLVTNKSKSDDNVFLNNLEEIRLGTIDIEKFKENLGSLTQPKKKSKSKKEEDESKEGAVLNQSVIDFLEFKHLEQFLRRIDITLNEDDLIFQIKEYLRINLAVEHYEDAYFEIEGRLRTMNYLTIKDNEKVLYSKADFSKKILQPVLDKVRNSKFYKTTEAYVENPKLENKIFAKQLLDLNVDLEDIIEYNHYMQICLANLKKWEERDNIILPEERELYLKQAVKTWKHRHQIRHRQLNSEENNSLDCYDDCMLEVLKLSSVEMDQDISNGTFIYLSDELRIGWIKKWKDKYGIK